MRVRLALESMRQGGIWDQLGGGFHRYSTDERWLVPHFEKMLYDNALLLRVVRRRPSRVRREPLFESTARDIAAWVTREMTDASGGYYASQDADSEGEDGVAEEGKFFVWNPNGVREALGDDELAAKAALLYFGVTRDGNFEEHGRVTFMTVLHENQADRRGRRAAARRARGGGARGASRAPRSGSSRCASSARSRSATRRSSRAGER